MMQSLPVCTLVCCDVRERESQSVTVISVFCVQYADVSRYLYLRTANVCLVSHLAAGSAQTPATQIKWSELASRRVPGRWTLERPGAACSWDMRPAGVGQHHVLYLPFGNARCHVSARALTSI